MSDSSALPDAIQRLQDEVDVYLGELFYNYSARKIRHGKMFRDAVFGYLWFHPHECVVIDSPLMQRLRYVHQTALAYQVYSSANHTRFEHSLGVAHLAGRMVTALADPGGAEVSKNDIFEVRMAGLLHDVGHALFSHLSESIMARRFDMELRAIRGTKYFKKRSIKFGEIFSFLMVRSRIFQEFWADVATNYPDIPLDMTKVAWLIVGQVDPEEQYRADIISGPFDADKLDYFARDCHFTGIKAELDIERILYTIKIRNVEDVGHTLVMRRGGVPHLEQILFGKMMLYTSVYHHHKVRTLECMIAGIFEKIWDDPSKITEPLLRFNRPIDFFRVSEQAFLVKGLEEPEIASQVTNLWRRQTLQRALVLNSATVRRREGNVDEHRKLSTLGERLDAARAIREIRELIYYRLPEDDRTSIHDLWIDIPSTPSLSEDAQLCLVELESDQPTVTLRSLFPTDAWVGAYRDNKSTGHVFYVSDEAVRGRVADKAQEVLLELFDLRLEKTAVSNAFKPD